MDPTTIASTAVAALAPYLIEGGNEASRTVVRDLYSWLKSKLTGNDADALIDLENAPSVEDNQADLRKRLAKAIIADPDFGEQLEKLLGALPGKEITNNQTINQIDGSGNIAVQVNEDNGSGVKIYR